MKNTNNRADCFNLGHIGWKYYNTIRKKAVEQEFSWTGLIISLSIAFFIVTASAQALSLTYQSLKLDYNITPKNEQKIYRLENYQHLNSEVVNDYLKATMDNLYYA